MWCLGQSEKEFSLGGIIRIWKQYYLRKGKISCIACQHNPTNPQLYKNVANLILVQSLVL